MGFYSRVIFPRLCEFSLNSKHVARHRKQLLARASGDVLEIGIGTGLNLPHYPETVRRITAIDPNPGMHAKALRRIEASSVEVDKHVLGGESLPFDDGSFDCVVSTFTLCSIGEVDQAMSEFFRVLRPGGKFLFLEHGLSREASVQKWQHRLNGLQRIVGDNCHLNRDIRQIVDRQPHESTECDEFYMEKTPRLFGYMYSGAAVR